MILRNKLPEKCNFEIDFLKKWNWETNSQRNAILKKFLKKWNSVTNLPEKCNFEINILKKWIFRDKSPREINFLKKFNFLINLSEMCNFGIGLNGWNLNRGGMEGRLVRKAWRDLKGKQMNWWWHWSTQTACVVSRKPYKLTWINLYRVDIHNKKLHSNPVTPHFLN